jgi:diguanylate cyclase (GGDEF)-like protein
MASADRTHTFTVGGEFAQGEIEADYTAERLPESLRHARLMFGLAVLLNALFLLSDWRFHGQEHFLTAITARTAIILVSLAAFAAVRTGQDGRTLLRLCLGWSAPVITGCAVLLTTQNPASLVMIFMLPAIFYLLAPLPFRWAAATGLACSAATLGANLCAAPPEAGPRLALALALLTANALLALLLMRMNRLQRMAWASGRAEQQAARELDGHRRMLQALLHAVPAPLIVFARGGGMIQANDAAYAYFGSEAIHSREALARCFGAGVLDRLAAGDDSGELPVETECALTLPDGGRRDALLATSSVPLPGGDAVLLIVMDITSRKEMEQRLEHLASTDPLTGLANRASFFASAAEELQRTRRYHRPLAVLMLDLDHFKRINDTCGHEAGDQALRAFASLCRQLLRETDTMGRIGGEEFAVLLPETSSDAALPLAERLCDAVTRLRPKGVHAPMTVSIGVSGVNADEASIEPALARADAALYQAKRNGRNRVEKSC